MTAALDISPLRQRYGLHLLEHHAARLEAAGISPEMAEARGYRSTTTKADLGRRGFTPAQRRVPGLLIPGWGVHGKPTFPQFRPDDPRLRDGKPVKYETPRALLTRALWFRSWRNQRAKHHLREREQRRTTPALEGLSDETRD